MVVYPQERTCILIADEQTLSREALCLWLMRVLPDAILLQVSSSEERFACKPECLSLILVALRQPSVNGFAMLQDFHNRFPFTPVVLMADAVDARLLAMAHAHGVRGLFQTTDNPEALLEMMRRALGGKPVFPFSQCPAAVDRSLKLSPRQAEVLQLLCEGKSNKEIAAVLNMSGNTVRTHVSAIFNILGVRNRTEAVIAGRHLI